MDFSADPAGAHLDGGIANEWDIGVKDIETYVNSDIYKFKH